MTEHTPTGPYLRAATPEDQPSQPCPPGHIAEPGRRWKGELVEVVYDPERHDIAFLWDGPRPEWAAGLEAEGWAQVDRDGHAELWVRDRLAAERRRLTQAATLAAGGRPEPAAGADLTGP